MESKINIDIKTMSDEEIKTHIAEKMSEIELQNMRIDSISLTQKTYNKIKELEDFTYILQNKRYLFGVKFVLSGKLKDGDLLLISEIKKDE